MGFLFCCGPKRGHLVRKRLVVKEMILSFKVGPVLFRHRSVFVSCDQDSTAPYIQGSPQHADGRGTHACTGAVSPPRDTVQGRVNKPPLPRRLCACCWNVCQCTCRSLGPDGGPASSTNIFGHSSSMNKEKRCDWVTQSHWDFIIRQGKPTAK